MTTTSELTLGGITALPLVHGRLPFAMEVRRLMLDRRFDALAVELPGSLENALGQALEMLPKVSVVTYGEHAAWEPGEKPRWYVAADPCDGIIEALRIARGERTPAWFVDADLGEFLPVLRSIPDAHAIHRTGLEAWYRTVARQADRWTPSPQDTIREAHMAARLHEMRARFGDDARILFLCGLAHWRRIRERLVRGDHGLHDADPPDDVAVDPAHPGSLMHVLGEMPALTWEWERHRSGLAMEPFRPEEAFKRFLLRARQDYEREFPQGLEKSTPQALRTLLLYLRKLVVGGGRLLPDPWSLAVAARGTVGNDYAVKLVEVLNAYPPNARTDDGVVMTENQVGLEDGPAPAIPRTPGEARSLRPLRLTRRPPRRDAARWRAGWNPYDHCSWPPEDTVIEAFRTYVSRRALTLAGLHLRRTEPFLTSFKDGIDIRETMRDQVRRRIHVKEEPPVAGGVGALVVIFEEDDDGTRFPWRTTWMAEHDAESTMAFYATNPLEDMVGPGIARMFYGGCLFIFPPVMIPDIWDDLRFERARRPSERLLLAALWYAREKFVAYASASPPADEVRQEAARLGKHIIYLPLTHFSRGTLERMRRAHVLNGRHVRDWASGFID